MRLLILGGTTESSALARALAALNNIEPILSLAGRTAIPAEPPIPFRIGGFGGVDGLSAYLVRERIDALIDATHPFAAQISRHAGAAAKRTRVPLAVFTRAPWSRQAGDDWRSVADLDAAALALGPQKRNVFVTSGRLGLSAFKRAPHHNYLIRSIDPPDPTDCPPSCTIILARGPFESAKEEALMRRHGIEVLVTKNSGGRLGEAKLDAARAMAIPVIMVERAAPEGDAERFTRLDDVLAWIERHRGASARRGASTGIP